MKASSRGDSKGAAIGTPTGLSYELDWVWWISVDY